MTLDSTPAGRITLAPKRRYTLAGLLVQCYLKATPPADCSKSVGRYSVTLEVFKMLREIRNTRQVTGESPRRWFFSHEQDLLVWINGNGQPIAFQLAYGKYRDEHAILWKVGQGFAHHRVDDGVREGLRKETPLLIPDGTFEA